MIASSSGISGTEKVKSQITTCNFLTICEDEHVSDLKEHSGDVE